MSITATVNNQFSELRSNYLESVAMFELAKAKVQPIKKAEFAKVGQQYPNLDRAWCQENIDLLCEIEGRCEDSVGYWQAHGKMCDSKLAFWNHCKGIFGKHPKLKTLFDRAPQHPNIFDKMIAVLVKWDGKGTPSF